MPVSDERKLSMWALELLPAAPDDTMRAKLSRLFALLIAASDENMQPDPRNPMFAFADAAMALWGGDVLGVEVQVRVEAGKTHVYRAGEIKPREYVLKAADDDEPTVN